MSKTRNTRIKDNGVSDVIHLRGLLEMQLMNAYNGEPIDERISQNTVVTAGRSWVLSRIYTNDAQTISHCGIGTGTTAPTTANTALGSETTRLAIGTFTTTNIAASTPSWRAETTFATNLGNTTLGEAALFNSSSSGTMLSRVTYSTINKTTLLFSMSYRYLLKWSRYMVTYIRESFLMGSNPGIGNEAEATV